MAELEYQLGKPGSRTLSPNQYALLVFIQPPKQANPKLTFIVRIQFGKALCGLTGRVFMLGTVRK